LRRSTNHLATLARVSYYTARDIASALKHANDEEKETIRRDRIGWYRRKRVDAWLRSMGAT